ncbi:MAG: class II fumarate hydratase [Desulforhopalus sp.]
MKPIRYRTEKDSMGEVKVPVDAFYGAQTQRAIENFTISSQTIPWKLIEALLHIKASAAQTNYELGLLSDDHCRLISDAVDELLKARPMDQFPLSIYQTGSGTSTNMNVNEVIAGMVSHQGVQLSPNDHVNLGQSSNDVIPTAIQLATSSETDSTLLPAITELAGKIRRFGRRHSDIVKTGRTHLMDALPIRLEDEFEAWAAQLDECEEGIRSGLTRMQRLPLGGTAVGSGVNCHPEFPAKAIARLNRRLDLVFTEAPSKFKGLSSLGVLVEFSGHLKTCAVALMKISNDLRWMNSGPLAGLGEIMLPPLQPGSSIMPAKINPVIPEAVCMATARIIGNDTTLNLAGIGGNFQLNTMLPLAGAALLESVELLSGCCRSLGAKAIDDMTVNRKTFEKALSYNPILVTSLNPVIGYLKAAEIAKKAQQEKRTVLDVALELTDIPREELQKLLDPANLAEGGDTSAKS